MLDPIKIIEQTDELRDQGKDLNKAISILEELLEEVRTDPVILSFYVPLVMKKLGNLYRDIGELEKAKETYQKALDIARNDFNKMEEADISAAMAFLELKTGDSNKALKYANKAVDYIGKKRGKKFAEVRSNSFAVLGNIYFETGRYDEAKYRYKRGLLIAKDAGFTKREVTILADMANLYIYRKEFDLAVKMLEKSLSKAKEEYIIALPSIYIRLSKISLIKGNMKEAKEYIDLALEEAKKIGLDRDIKESEEALEHYLELING